MTIRPRLFPPALPSPVQKYKRARYLNPEAPSFRLREQPETREKRAERRSGEPAKTESGPLFPERRPLSRIVSKNRPEAAECHATQPSLVQVSLENRRRSSSLGTSPQGD